MGFERGRPIKSLIYGLTHPLQMARERPIMFGLLVGTGVLFLGIQMEWWSLDSLRALLPFGKN